MKRTICLNGFAAALAVATLLLSPVQAHEKHAAAPAVVEWLQRPLDQTQFSPQDKVEFAQVQTECVQTGATSFGPQQPWQACTLVHSGFVATIGLQDFFYADYCLIRKGDVCARQAQVLFRNRAYRPEAFLDLARLDPPGTRYESPVLIGSATENVLSTAVLLPGKSQKQRRYFRYAQERWIPIDGTAWLQALRARLPAGLSVRVRAQDALPDPRSMMLSLPLYRGTKRGGSVDIRLDIEAGQLALADFTVTAGTK